MKVLKSNLINSVAILCILIGFVNPLFVLIGVGLLIWSFKFLKADMKQHRKNMEIKAKYNHDKYWSKKYKWF